MNGMIYAMTGKPIAAPGDVVALKGDYYTVTRRGEVIGTYRKDMVR